jgi:hypothetical protein
MQWDGRNKPLRCALDLPTGTLIGEHATKVDVLRGEHLHTVVLRQAPDDLTCLPYAFELTNNPIYRAIAADFDCEVFAGPKFMEWLLNNRLCEVSGRAPGVLALYFSDKIWRHAGFVISTDRITSKWGTFPVYDHHLWEVPISYGNELRFFKRPAPKDSLSLFLDYCRYEGVTESDIADILSENGKGP